MPTQTVEEILASIETHAAAPDLRELPRSVGQVAHQGDVYLHRVKDDHPRGKLLGTRQIAVGTTVGSRHVVEGHVEVYEGVELPPGFRLPSGQVDGRKWQARTEDVLGPVVVWRAAGVLTHPEHAHHACEVGVDQVTYQYDWATRARVQD